MTAVNAPLPVKPGATVLLNGTDERGRSRRCLSSQRLRPRQGDCVDRAGHLAVADARLDSARGSDARALLASVDAVARGRRPDVVDVRTTRTASTRGRRDDRSHGRGQAFVELNDATVIAKSRVPAVRR